MNRRNFIQQLVYTIVALFFGPAALAELDLAESERFVDLLDRELGAVMPSDQSMIVMALNVFQWFRQANPSASDEELRQGLGLALLGVDADAAEMPQAEESEA